MIFDAFPARSTETERLDRGDYTPKEYRRWQKEMWFIHRAFGEVRALRRTLVADIERSALSSPVVLEIAAGSGGLLKYLQRATHKRLRTIGLEISDEAARSIAKTGSMSILGDALRLPLAEGSVDHVFTTLFLHHLNEEDGARLLSEMARVARRTIHVIDLDRRLMPYLLFRIFGTVLLQRFTRDDGALSIKRAYRPAELERLARAAGLTRFTVIRSAVNRTVLVAEV